MPPLDPFHASSGVITVDKGSSDDDDSSDGGDGHYELPDGRLVCRHGFVTCGICCVDFSFMDEVLGLGSDDDDDEDDLSEDDDDSMGENDDDLQDSSSNLFPNPFHEPVQLGPSLTRGTGRVFPAEFTASESPFDLFRREAFLGGGGNTRYVHRDESDKALILTDGACLNNGQPDPKAGWAFIFSPDKRAVSARLENSGPLGDPGIQSSNRAELRAVIAALRFRAWHGEGFKHLVIATDSEYVVKGATGWARTWVRNNWKTKGGVTVKNKDLWEMLLGEVEQKSDDGLSIAMWRISRELNTEADMAAKAAAARPDVPDDWADVHGILC